MFKKLFPTLIAVILLISVVAITGNNNQYMAEKENSVSVSRVISENKEMRAVWVTYMDLDMRGTDMSYKAFIKKFQHIADTSKEKGFNTLIVQVRPFSDAFYTSQYYPYSHLLTGTQGKDPGYDPLKYMCHYAHKINLEIHAWINPYRIKLNDSPQKLSENHPYLNNQSMGVVYKGDIYINPSSNEGRTLIKNGVREIIKNYDIDGIQFDDYFYPTSSTAFDKKEYKEYVSSVGRGNEISLKSWRITNVNILIAETYSLIHNLKDEVVFGVSPQGNIRNNYDLYADVKSWCEKSGYIDYICPQLYYSLENPTLTFKDALNQWMELEFCQDVKLYIGLAGYKIGTDSDDGTWNKSSTILQEELKLVRKNNINGFMFYSFANLETKQASKEVNNLTKLLD